MNRKTIFIATAVITSFICQGCATLRNPVPKDLVAKARVDNLEGIRIMTGESNILLQENLIASVKQERPGDFQAGLNGAKVYPVLAISGGGANGAYGAGLLKGWSESGTRPVFKVVTGVSTGAIIAPFAFLGKDYDPVIEKYYTMTSTKDVLAHKFPFTSLFSNSFSSNAPLARTIDRLMDKNILAKIAVEHKRGRRLFVGTANLDAERFVIWDMGAIAVAGDEELFQKVMLASAAIPMVFPPSIFYVNADGKAYDEMHADGGTLAQFFTIYGLLEGMGKFAKELGIDPAKLKGNLYIIRNGYLSPSYAKVKDSLPSLAQRSFELLIDTQGLGDAYRTYVYAKKRGTNYNLAFIPSDCRPHSEEMFDPLAMRQLFDRGYKDAVGGYKWHKAPPGVDGTIDELE